MQELRFYYTNTVRAANKTYKDLSIAELDELSKRFLLSKSHLKQLLKHISWYQGRVTVESKDYIVKICQEQYTNPIEMPPISGKKHKMSILNQLCNVIESKSSQEMLDMKDQACTHPLASLSRKQIKDTIEYYFLDRRKKTIGAYERNYVQNLISNNVKRAMSNDEIQYITNKLELTRAQVRRLIRSCRDPIGEITAEKKKEIYTYLQERPIDSVDTDHIRLLAKRLSLSRRQVIGIVSRILDPPGVITQEKIKILRNEYENNGKRHLLLQLNELCKTLELSKFQLYSLIHRLSECNKIQKSHKLAISKYYQEKGTWEEEDTKKFRNEFHLTQFQINYIVQQLQDPIQEMTAKKKEMLLQWMHENPDVILSQKKAKELQSKIQLSVSQIIKLSRSLKQRPQPIYTSSKRIIKEFLQENKFQYPDSLQLKMLEERSQLTRPQIHSIVFNILMNRKPLEEETRKKIFHWIKQFDYRNDREAFERLSKETGIHLARLRQIVWHLEDSLKRGDVDASKSKYIEDWINRNEMRMPKGEDLKLIAKTLQISHTQVRQVAKRILDPPRPIGNARQVISDWLMNHGFPETKTEWRDLHTASGVSRQQMHDIVRGLKIKHEYK